MIREFQLTRLARHNFIAIMEAYSLAQLNTVPIGFNNNMIWNIAHVVATYDMLCYKLHNIPTRLDGDFIEEFKKGTMPQRMLDQSFVDDLKKKMLNQVDWIERDYKGNVFPSSIPNPYETSYRFVLNNIEDVITFNNVHENLHMGIVMSLRKFI